MIFIAYLKYELLRISRLISSNIKMDTVFLKQNLGIKLKTYVLNMYRKYFYMIPHLI